MSRRACAENGDYAQGFDFDLLRVPCAFLLLRVSEKSLKILGFPQVFPWRPNTSAARARGMLTHLKSSSPRRIHMRITKLILTAFLFVLALFAANLATHGQTDWTVVDTFHVGGEGGWDYLTV